MIKKLLVLSLLCISISLTAQWIPTTGTYYGSATSFASKGDTILVTDPKSQDHASGVYRSVDGGVLWNLIYRTPEFLKSIVLSGNHFLAASSATVLFSGDGGENWVKRDNGLTTANNNILFTENKKVYLSKADGLFVTSDDGLNWVKVNSIAPVESISCTFKFGTILFAGTSNKGLLRSDDGGSTWSKATADLSNMKIVSLTTDGTNLFTSTDGSGVFKSADSGVTWNAINTDLTELKTTSLAMVDSTLFVGTISGLFCSVNKGATWAKQPQISGVVNTCYVRNQTIFIAVQSDAVYSSSDQGKSWDRLTNGTDQPLSLMMLADGNDLYVISGDHWNKVYKTSDRGESWQRVDSMMVDVEINTLLMHNNKLYAGGSSGLSVSNDHGHTWNKINYLVNEISAIVAWKDTLYASSYGFKGLHASYDNGNTWENFYLTGQVTALTVKDGTIYAGTGSNGLLRSTDKGITFTRIDGGLIYDQIKAIYIDDQSFLVGTASGLFQSTDNGATWIKKNTSIGSNSYITSFLRYGNKLFLSSLDGVYVSNDYGDHWKPLNDGLSNTKNFSLARISSTIFVSSLQYGVFKRDTADIITNLPILTSDKLNFSIFPNPSTGKIQLLMPGGMKQVRITNTLGQVVTEFRTEAVEKQIELDKKGMHIITIQKEDAVISKKIIVQE